MSVLSSDTQADRQRKRPREGESEEEGGKEKERERERAAEFEGARESCAYASTCTAGPAQKGLRWASGGARFGNRKVLFQRVLSKNSVE